MLEEKIRCDFCNRKNNINNDLCDSCGAWLPEISLKIKEYPDLDMEYLNALASGHSAFSVSLETGKLLLR